MATQKTAAKSSSRKRSPYTTAASSAVDAQLERYRSMRNFDITTEPSGNGRATTAFALRKPTTTRGLPFVIQKHEASHLHYDLRLSWGGVLKSWAVAKGPSYNPRDRRLAVEVEDHPLEYGGFEGVIPQGQYGGGTVMIWDQGTWWPQLGSENVDACLRAGHLKFEMNGSKLKGKWALIRMKPSASISTSSHPNWLLIKEHDKFEHDPTDPSITEQRPNSAITGRSIKQIAAAHDSDHAWDTPNHHPTLPAATSQSLSHETAPTPAAQQPQPHSASTQPPNTLPQEHERELIIAGFTLSSEGPDRIGSLLLGYYEAASTGKQKPSTLIYAGRTGTGFSQQARRDLLTQLIKLRVPEPAFAEIPSDATRETFWVRPVLVAQIRFTAWTPDHLIRQAAFLGLREDKPATEVTRRTASRPESAPQRTNTLR